MLDTFKKQLKAKAKAAGANLSQKRIDAMADRLDKKNPDLAEEAEHDTKIDDLYTADDFKDFGSVDDHQKAKEAKDKKDKEAKAKENGGSESGSEPKSEMDELKELVKGLATSVQTLTKEKQQGSMRDKLKANDKLKDVPQDFYDEWPLPDTDDAVDAFAEKVSVKYKAFNDKLSGQQQEETNAGFAASTKPAAGAGAANGKVSADIIAFAKKKNETVTNKKQ